MEKVRGYFQTLYQREEPHPPDIPLETHMDPVQVNYLTPSKAELEEAFRCLRPIKSGRHTHLHVEYFKQWLKESYFGENLKTPPLTER